MSGDSWSNLWHNRQLDLNFFQAFHAIHSYPRHSHDYYVIAVVDRGLQSFTFAGSKHVTPVNGLILLNPGDVHTGEPVNELGFGFSAIYPDVHHMETIMLELFGRSVTPAFSRPRADDLQMAHAVRSLHTTLKTSSNPLECESKFLQTFVELSKRYSDRKPSEQKPGSEHEAVKKMRNYIHENYAQPISLSELAQHVNFSSYYLLHIFRAEIGMPPHTYLENFRIRQAQKLLADGSALIEVANQVGFASQSHFTQRFKQVIGIPPGEYARQVKK